MKRSSLLLSLLAVFSILALMIVSCGGGNNGSNGESYDLLVSALTGDDVTGDGVTIPFKTISAAMETAKAGMVVKVMPGIYDTALGETFPIKLAAGVTLVGDVASKGAGTEPTMISGADLAYSTLYSAVLGSEGAAMSGFAVSTVNTVNYCGIITVDSDMTIADNTFRNSHTGIRYEDGGNLVIRNNDFHNEWYGVYDSGTGSQATIQDNYMEGGGYGIRLSGGDADVMGNTFTDQVYSSIQVMTSNTPSIIGNNFVTNSYNYAAIHTFSISSATIRNNTFTDSAPCVLLWHDSTADIGTSVDPGMNNFTAANGVAVYNSSTGDATAMGNAWANDPPLCGTDIITAASGSVYFGTGGGENCP